MRPVTPRITARPPTVLPAPRWTALLVAAVVVVSVIGLDFGRAFVAPPTTRAGDVAGATLVRDGDVSPLLTGMALQEGDIVRTDAGGHATLELGGGIARLAGTTAVRLTTLDRTERGHRPARRPGLPPRHRRGRHVSGRAPPRSTGPPMGRPSTSPASRIRLAANWRASSASSTRSRIAGPGLQATLDEGDVATIHLGSDAPDASTDVVLGPVAPSDLADPWLIENARRDVALGFEPGIFGDVLAALEPDPSPTTVTPSLEPSEPTVDPSAEPTSLGPDPSATPNEVDPTARPTRQADAEADAQAHAEAHAHTDAKAHADTDADRRLAQPDRDRLPGRVHLPRLEQGTGRGVPSLPDPDVHDGVHPAGLPAGRPGDRAEQPVRDGSVVARAPSTPGSSSGMTSATARSPSPPVTMPPRRARSGPCAARPSPTSGTCSSPPTPGSTFDWTPFGGPEACFTWNKIVVSTTDTTPSYLDGATQVWVGENPATASAHIDELDPGTYHIRLQVLRASEAGSLLVAETDPTTFVVP